MSSITSNVDTAIVHLPIQSGTPTTEFIRLDSVIIVSIASVSPKQKSPATEKRIWRREEEKEEIKEAAIAARNGPRIVVEVMITEAMIIQIMATAAFRWWGTSGCAFASTSPVVGIPFILLGSMWLG